MTTHHGSCHCGAVRYEVDGPLTDAYTCDCSLCRRRSATMCSVHESRLRITQGADNLALYQWNARIAKHHFCKTCGIYPFHKKRSMPDHYGVNLACLEDFDVSSLPVGKAEGVGMAVIDPDARDAWPGPRQA